MDNEASASEPLGIDVSGVERWLDGEVEGLVSPYRYDRITGGHSNLTYLVTDGRGTRFVLRRPPVGDLLATAHNVTREHDIMRAVAGTGVPVPQMLGSCHDPDVTGAPFYVMAHVAGVVLHTAEDADELLPAPNARRRAGETLVDALVALHHIDPDSVGLGELSRKDGYLDRQLKRWAAQWDTYELDDLDGMVELHSWLLANRPDETAARIVHGDFRLGNALLDEQGSVVAMLDWELCTLGEPLADVAYLLRSWSTADARFGESQLPSAGPGFPNAAELAARYASASGRSLDDLGYWTAFTAWRAAAILGGVYRRYLDGKMGAPPDDLALFAVEVEARMHQGLAIAHAGS